MEKKEMLELAAKAIGLIHPRYHEGTYKPYDCGTCILHNTEDGEETRSWNPLSDDGQALRLAAKLGLSLHFQKSTMAASNEFSKGWYLGGWMNRTLDNEYDYRRLIVRAAAEIGKVMP